MTRSLIARLGPVAGAVGALALVGSSAAHAGVNAWGPGTLAPGTEICIGAAAGSDARAIGSASPPGVVFRVFRDGVQINSADAVRRNSFDRYYVGAGTYRFCARNALGLGMGVDNVSLTLLTDADA